MTKTTKGATRAMFFTSTSPFAMLRGPQVAYAPDGDEGGGGDETPPEFQEQEGDREPEPETGAQEESGGAEEGAEEGEEEAATEEEGGEEDGATGGAEEEAEATADPAPAKGGWKDRQIKKLREQKATDDAEKADLKRRVDAAEALLAAPAEERDAGEVERVRKQIREEESVKYREEQRYKTINTGLEAMDAEGTKEFAQTWSQQVADVAEVMGPQLAARPDFLEALTDLPNRAAVYHDLTSDPDKLEAVLAMPAHKMGMELARMSADLAKPKPRSISRAPAPITPLERARGERSLEELANDPNGSMEEFDKRMRAIEEKRAKRY